ncbi:MAG: hypothetical protein ACOCXJ_01575, partial [Planctomycetota bacterium]
SAGTIPATLANEADFQVGADLAMEIDFMRVCLGTLAAAGTSIDELYAWQFDGPQFRDFTGAPRGEAPTAGAIQAR